MLRTTLTSSWIIRVSRGEAKLKFEAPDPGIKVALSD
jgi:hypothetical protein